MKWKTVDKAKPMHRALLWVDDKIYEGAVMGRIAESVINGDDTLYFFPDGFHGDCRSVTHFCAVEAPKPRKGDR